MRRPVQPSVQPSPPGRRPQVARAAGAVVLAALLAGCARTTDEMRPRIIITEPEAGTISRDSSMLVRGYVVDDLGVREVRVNDTELQLDFASRKIVPFAFRTSTDTTRADYAIVATDLAGRTSRTELPLRYDPNPPKLDITKVEQEGATLRVTGVATDDDKVDSITVDGSRLAVGQARRVPFYAEVNAKEAKVVVRDMAGNATTRTVTP